MSVLSGRREKSGSDKRKEVFRYIEEGFFQAHVIESLLESYATDFLYTTIVKRIREEAKGWHDFNRDIHAYPLQRPTSCSLTGEIRQRTRSMALNACEERREVPEYEKIEIERTQPRLAELRLLWAERLAVLQLALASFFAIAALVRAL